MRIVFSPVSSSRGCCEDLQLGAVAWPLQQQSGGDEGQGAELPLDAAGIPPCPWAALQSRLHLVFCHCHFSSFSIPASRLGPVAGKSFHRPGNEFDCLYLNLHCGKWAVHVFQSLNDIRTLLLNELRSFVTLK